MTVRAIGDDVGIEAFLAGIRSNVKAQVRYPLPVRYPQPVWERMIPKTGGKLRRLGIPTDPANCEVAPSA
jgi:RNA-directed DNA polymerase